MKIKSFKFWICFLVIFVTSINAQDKVDVFPSSPNTYEISKYINLPVDLSTGIPDINYELVTLNGMGTSVKVGLSYHSRGIKVAEIPSWVGTGWFLNIGGSINRSVVGIPDEKDNGYIGKNLKGKLVYNDLSADFLRNVDAKYIDSQPDIYNFSFLDFKGKFTFDSNGDIIMLPNQDFKIFPGIGPKKVDNFWTIIDKEGNKYKFGITSNSIENSEVKIETNSAGQITSRLENYISSWYLNEIETIAGEKVFFKYINGNSTSYDLFSKNAQIRQSPSTAPQNIVNFVTTKIKTINPVYPSEIITTKGYIKINTSIRDDFGNGLKIDKIEMYNNENNSIKKILFNYDYFKSLNCNSIECKRLKLLGVLNETNGKLFTMFNFEYNEEINLPSRNSPQFDHWGYYNVNNENVLGYGTSINRSPNFEGTFANVLKKINFQTGGSVNFEYELNDFNYNSQNLKTGGLRISKMTENFIFGEPITKLFNYKIGKSDLSSGTSAALPIYTSSGVAIGDEPFSNLSVISLVSNSYRDLLDLNGVNTYYREVKVIYPDNSMEENFFSNFESHSDIKYQDDYKRYALDFYNLYFALYIDPNGEPFSPSSITKFNERGMLLKKVWKDCKGDILRQIENKYKILYKNVKKSSKGVSVSRFANNSSGTKVVYNVGSYMLLENNYELDEVYEKVYDLKNNMYLETIKKFNYSPDFPTLISEEESRNSKKNFFKKKIFYPFDMINSSQSSEMQKLVSQNRINVPIKKVDFIDNIKTNEMVTKYEESGATGNLLLPKELHSNKGVLNIDITTTSDRKISYDQYDEKGNLLQYVQEGGAPVSIIWGYNKTQPIAKIENATYGSVASYVSNLENLSNSGTQGALMTGLNQLRTSLPNAMVTTYTYIPLVGVSTITDPKGLKTTYEYDAFNRLKWVKDQDGNVLQKYCYNYKGDQINCEEVVYKNIAKGGSFTRNNCDNSATGGAVVYTVAAGTYTSTISQADADNKAQLDVNTNGQNYANTNASCSTIFKSAYQSRVFTSKICLRGEKALAVTYEVLAGKYQSTISQADADNQALKDIELNGQNYANDYGGCAEAIIYKNVLTSRIFISQLCLYNETGLPITYRVYAGTYTSTISQSDADLQALNDIRKNGQNYANDNGGCKPKKPGIVQQQ